METSDEVTSVSVAISTTRERTPVLLGAATLALGAVRKEYAGCDLSTATKAKKATLEIFMVITNVV